MALWLRKVADPCTWAFSVVLSSLIRLGQCWLTVQSYNSRRRWALQRPRRKRTWAPALAFRYRIYRNKNERTVVSADEKAFTNSAMPVRLSLSGHWLHGRGLWNELKKASPRLPIWSRWPMANSKYNSGSPSRTSSIRKGIMKAPRDKVKKVK